MGSGPRGKSQVAICLIRNTATVDFGANCFSSRGGPYVPL